MKETFAIRLQKALDKADMKAADLARATNTPESVISQYKRGMYVPKQRRLEAFAEALHTTIPYLMGDDAESSPSEFFETYSPKDSMPVLGRVAAGLPMYTQENIEEYIANDFTDGMEYFALRVKGDSMNAAGINEGDYIVVRQQDIVDNGEIAVVLVNGDDATVKRFSRDGDTVVLTPQSYNPAHQPQIYNVKAISIRIVGKVVEARHKF